MIELSAADAWRNVNEDNESSRWKSVAARAAGPALIARGGGRIGIRRDDDIFCIGSCFAKNIERKLVADGFHVLSHAKFAPTDGASFEPLPNVFNIRAIVNQFRWGLAGEPPSPQDSLIADGPDHLYDPHSNENAFRGAPDIVHRHRAGVTANMRRLAQCRVVIVTLGLVEVWFDRKSGLYLNVTLPRYLMEREPDRFVLRVLNYQACRNGLEEAYALLKEHGRQDVQIFLSVSPVPLAATFTRDDVLVANNYSKSSQIAAARDFAALHDNVHYVPSFESVMFSTRKLAWKTDLRHVTDEMVDRITDYFLACQIESAEAPAAPPIDPGESDWPRAPDTRIEARPGVPKFFGAVPGDADFPAGFPIVTASSVLKPELDASCLMSASPKRIWHSRQSPTYPEWLHFKFEKPLTVRRLFLQNQDLHPERSPAVFALDAMLNGLWQTILVVPGGFRWSMGGEWLDWPTQHLAPSLEFRLRIHANSGDPGLVTVQNVYLAP